MFLDGKKKTIWSDSYFAHRFNQNNVLNKILVYMYGNRQCWLQRPFCKHQGKYNSTGTSFLRFVFSNFRYFLTLFSKFFAPFPHGTCTLSVSRRYLALDGIYHLLWAAIPNNSTHWHQLKDVDLRGLHPLCLPIPKDFIYILVMLKSFDHNSIQKYRFTLWAVDSSVALT